MTTIFDKCENILQSSGSETSLGSASAPAHFFLVPLVSLVVPGVLPVPRHGPVGGAPAPSVLARSEQKKSTLMLCWVPGQCIVVKNLHAKYSL